MIVITIVGLLLAVAIPSMLHARDQSASRICRENLRAITHAKQRWAMDNNKPTTVVPVWDDIVPIYLQGQMPVCPGGGTYSIESLDENATCSYGSDHTFD